MTQRKDEKDSMKETMQWEGGLRGRNEEGGGRGDRWRKIKGTIY